MRSTGAGRRPNPRRRTCSGPKAVPTASQAAARLEFAAQGLSFALLKPTRLPIFDGAIAIRSLAVREAGTDRQALEFEANRADQHAEARQGIPAGRSSPAPCRVASRGSSSATSC